MASGLLERTAQAVSNSRTASRLAQLGLLARAAFYVLLAYLVLRLAVGAGGRPANASGALHTVSATPLGRAPVAAAAVGFAVLGGSRLLGALRDHQPSRTSRVTTGLQGIFYLVLTAVPASFTLGSRSTGTEQQERTTTARVLGLPAGRAVIVVAGLAFIGVCVWQVVTALRTGFTASLRTEDSSPWVRRLIRLTGRVGITARSLAFLPLGVFLVVAGAQVDPRRARGLDATLAEVAHRSGGRAALVAVAAGFLVFAVYTLLEARYRDLDAGQ